MADKRMLAALAAIAVVIPLAAIAVLAPSGPAPVPVEPSTNPSTEPSAEPSAAPPASDQPASEPPAPVVDDGPIPAYIKEYAALWEDSGISHYHFLGNVTASYDAGEIRFAEDEEYVLSDVPVLVEIAGLELDRGNRTLADRYVSILTDIARDDADVHALLSVVAFVDGDRVTAAVHAENAIRADPDGLYPNFVKFGVLFVDGNYEDALPYGERVLELDSKNQMVINTMELIRFRVEN
ncbi:MAG: hypothetical protein MPK62_02190 [Alphaproteobacteria bacterium]|nr:hypothetical protein [Alphaproteobacteria bacterium]MDA8029944.1 hypothetical protein [Alphaproteobacteria bacterium]